MKSEIVRYYDENVNKIIPALKIIEGSSDVLLYLPKVNQSRCSCLTIAYCDLGNNCYYCKSDDSFMNLNNETDKEIKYLFDIDEMVNVLIIKVEIGNVCKCIDKRSGNEIVGIVKNITQQQSNKYYYGITLNGKHWHGKDPEFLNNNIKEYVTCIDERIKKE